MIGLCRRLIKASKLSTPFFTVKHRKTVKKSQVSIKSDRPTENA